MAKGAQNMTKGTGVEGSDDYIASKPLMEIVNVSLYSANHCNKRRTGTGQNACWPTAYRKPSEEVDIWNIKSSTKAKDGSLMFYDTVQRLNDARFRTRTSPTSAQINKMGSWARPRGRRAGHLLMMRSIKPISNLPRDLLNGIGRDVFHIPELDETVKANIAHRRQYIIRKRAS